MIMKLSNAQVRENIQKNKKIFTVVRRADISLQFRAHMIEKGIRNVDVAERLGVSEANVSRWLKGNQNLSMDTLYMLADAIEEKLTIFVGARHLEDESSCAGEYENECQYDSGCESSLMPAAVGKSNVVSMSQYKGKDWIVLGSTRFQPAKSTNNIRLNGEADERAVAAA